MANVIKPKRSYTATNTPTLAAGELGLNATDGKIWIGNAAGSANVLVSSLARSDHTGTLSVANGGTGATTLTANNVILGNGTSAPTFVAPSTSGNLLTSNGTTWQSTAPAASSSMPTGALMPYAGSTAPSGYLLCDGSSVSSTTYLALHAIISNTYGGSAYTGAAGLSFNLPSMAGRMVMGAGTGAGLTARTLGGTVGVENTTLATTNLPSHNHAFTPSGTVVAESAHTHASANAGWHAHASNNLILLYVGSGGGANLNAGTTWQAYNMNATMQGNGDHNHGNTNYNSGHTHGFTGSAGTTGASGSGSSFTNMPPAIGLNYIIKT